VSRPPYTPGEEITQGSVYRRIPHRTGYFEAQRPTFLAFRPRECDQGAISTLLMGYVTEDEAATNPEGAGRQLLWVVRA
jgi:hypothetical protein